MMMARHALRNLARAPRFFTACVFTLGLALSGTATLLNLLETFVFRRMAVPAANELVAIYPLRPGGASETSAGFSSQALQALGERQQVLNGACGVTAGYFTLNVQLRSGAARPRMVEGVTGDCYRLLGVRPAIGRLIATDDVPTAGDASQVVVISDRMWQQELGSSPDVIGRTVRVEGVPLTIIGVFPATYRGLNADEASDIALPITLTWARTFAPPLAMHAVGRLRQGISIAEATAQLTAIWPQAFASAHVVKAPSQSPPVLRVVPLANGVSGLRERYRQPLYALVALAGCLLLLACVNVGGLSLARVLDRREAFAVQLALGGSRSRLAVQLFYEAIAIGVTAALLAFPIARLGAQAAAQFLWTGVRPFTVETTSLVATLLTTGSIAILGAVVVAAPGWMALSVRNWDLGARTVGHGARRGQRVSVIAAQIALCFVLAFCAVLFTRNLLALRQLPLGYAADRLQWVWLSNASRTTFAPTIGYADTLLSQIAALPGVERAAMSQGAFGAASRAKERTPVKVNAADATSVEAISDLVSPEFFRTTSIPLLQGREFTWSDVGTFTLDSVRPPTVVIVNRSLADRLFPNGDALGKTVRIRVAGEREVSVVGIVDDATPGDPRIQHVPQYYLPLGAVTPPAPSLVLRVNTVVTEASLRAIVDRLGRHDVLRVSAMTDQVGRFLAQERLITSTSLLFAVLAVVVSIAGLYAAMSQTIIRRRREVVIRIALGATPNAIRSLVLSEACWIVLIGLAVGAPAALAGRHAVGALLSGEAPNFTIVLAVTGSAIAMVVFAVSAWPAQRAAQTSAATALKAE